MPTPVAHKTVPHTLVNIGGTLFGGGTDAEIWQVGIRVVDSTNAGPVADPAGYAATIGPLLATWFTTNDATLTTFGAFSNSQLTFVKANNIGADALYTGSGGLWAPSGTVNGSGAATGVLPPILTLCCTLTTAFRNGLAAKGRIYVPWSIAATPGYRYPTQQAAVTRRVKALLSVLKQPIGGNAANNVLPVVVSILKASDARTPALNYVTGVKCGDVIDVQRRRKNKLREAYVAAVWP